MLLLYLFCIPIGEAKNPGPMWHTEVEDTQKFLWIGSANPTQLLNKEDVFDEWGQGVWTFSESSATEQAVCTIRNRLTKKGFNVLFGAPVAQQQKSTVMRGKAGGVATVTSFPIQPYQYPAPDFLFKSTRYMDCLVHVNQKLSIYVATLYGVAGQNSAHPTSLTYDIFNQAAERGLSYKGPAVICGDFNVPLESLEAWTTLRNHGWFDAAYVDSIKFQRDLQPTSKHGSRHTFILMNRYLSSSFYACRTVENFDFDSHPLLVAGLNIETIVRSQCNWVLPKSFDSFLFDEDEIRKHSKMVADQRSHLFDAAIEHSNLDEAAKQFTIAVEQVFKESAVCTEGKHIRIPQGHFGRHKGTPFRHRKLNIPCVKPARSGDFNPIVSQLTNGLRLHTKQLRRLKSIVDQAKSLYIRHNTNAEVQCQELWDSILNAHGFSGGFKLWICQNGIDHVPIRCPDLQYLQHLHDTFHEYHNSNVQQFFLSRRKNNRIDLDIDIQKGGATCFRDVKDAPIPPIDAIHWSITHELVKNAWSKEGKTHLLLKDKPRFKIDVPVTFQGQVRNIVRMTERVVQLDNPVKLRDAQNLTITQTNTSSEPDCMQEQLENFWKTLWQRDSSSEEEQDWTKANEFITCLADCPSCEYEPITASKWFASLKGVSRKSARGADGFSTRDFMMINHELLDWLLRIIQKIENNVAWPKQWTISKVTVLAKGSKPKSPLDIRPITILPKVYRLWSRIRSLEVLRHLKGLMPPQIAATAGGVSADQVAAFTALIIESSKSQGEAVCGLIIDLIKCYNTVPWQPCKQLLRHLGIPDAYHVPFFSFMENLGRAFQIHEHCGKLISCTTGIPEGCAMSVAIMAALSWWCYAVLKEKHPTNTTLCYADNWGLIAKESHQLFNGTLTLFDFIDSLKMQVSVKKSWFWGSSLKLRKELRAPPQPLQNIEVVNHAVDLGCDQNYTKKIVHSKQKARFAKAKRVLKRISKKTLPKRFRPTITQAAGFSIVAYGVEISRVADATWSKLRTAVPSALDRNAAGSNPFLACICGKSPNDPQFRAIVRTMFFWRRYFKCFYGSKDQFCNMLVDPVGHGPASYFSKSLQSIGWTPQPGGLVSRSDGTAINWVVCSSTYLKKTFRKYWCDHVANKIQHRKDFDVCSIDEYNICLNFEKFCPKDKSLLQTYLAGAAYTKDVVSKYSSDGISTCPHCDQSDSKEHRLLHCPKFQEIRGEFWDVVQWVQQMPIATRNLAIIPRYLGAEISIIANQKIWPSNHIPEPNNSRMHVFSDGSAFWQDQPLCTLAGSAAAEFEYMGGLKRVISSMPLPGVDHNSYRSEIFAVLLTLQNVYSPTIYCDCQAVVETMNDLLGAHSNRLVPKFCDHWDIWMQVWEQIHKRPPNTIWVVKVKAHLNPEKIVCQTEKWKAVCNNTVDVLAKQAVTSWEPVYSTAKNAYDEIQHRKNMHLGLCKMLVKMGNLSVEKIKVVVPDRIVPTFDELCPNPNICHISRIAEIQKKCPFGDEFLQRVVNWASKLKWPNVATGNISMLELYIDYVLESKSLAPVPIKYASDGRVTAYALRDQNVDAKIVVHSLAQQNVIWNRFLKWAFANNIALWGRHHLPPTNCLGHVGYSLRTPAVACRPILVCGMQACHTLYNIFHTDAGKIRTLNVAFNGP